MYKIDVLSYFAKFFKNTDPLQSYQAEEFSTRIQKLASQGSAADRQLVGPKFWMS